MQNKQTLELFLQQNMQLWWYITQWQCVFQKFSLSVYVSVVLIG